MSMKTLQDGQRCVPYFEEWLPGGGPVLFVLVPAARIWRQNYAYLLDYHFCHKAILPFQQSYHR